MLYSDSLREMMQNAVNESFWDGLGVEIGGLVFWGGVPGFSGGDTPVFYRCARSIENFCKIKMVVARASGMDLASILSQNTFLTLECAPRGVR